MQDAVGFKLDMHSLNSNLSSVNGVEGPDEEQKEVARLIGACV